MTDRYSFGVPSNYSLFFFSSCWLFIIHDRLINKGVVLFLIPLILQGRSQVSKQDEASQAPKARAARGAWPPENFEILEVQNCSLKSFSWHFSLEKSIFVKVRISIFFC